MENYSQEHQEILLNRFIKFFQFMSLIIPDSDCLKQGMKAKLAYDLLETEEDKKYFFVSINQFFSFVSDTSNAITLEDVIHIENAFMKNGSVFEKVKEKDNHLKPLELEEKHQLCKLYFREEN